MKAFQIRGPEDCTFLDLPVPSLETEDSVIVEVKAVGICGSDVHSYRHGLNCPVIPGHEVAGVVCEKGSRVEKFEIGDHVVLEPLVACGICPTCKKGRKNVCMQAKCIGCQLDGGMREYFQYDQYHWHKIPKELPWESVTLIEPYTVGIEVVSQGQVEEGDTVLIHGAGPAGLIALDICKKLGAVCIVSEVVDGRLERAGNMGADFLINPGCEDLQKRVKEITCGEGPNVIIDAAGLAPLMEENVRLVSQAGRIVCMGIDPRKAAFEMPWVSVKEITIVGSRMQSGHFPRVIEHSSEYLESAKWLITDKIPFAEAHRAMDLAARTDPDTSKVVVMFD